MPRSSGLTQYVLLPPRGLRASAATASPDVRSFFRAADRPAAELAEIEVADGRVRLRVVDSIGPDGAKLVEAPPDSLMALRSLVPGVRVVPVVHYTPAVAPRPTVLTAPEAARAAAATLTVKVVSQTDKSPIAGAFVVAFTNFSAGAGAQGVTNARGEVKLALGASSSALDRLYVYPTTSFWSLLKTKVKATDGMQVALRPLDLGFVDGVRYFYPNAPDDAGKGVRVAVIDTGVATHPDLVIDGGANLVPGENPADFGDNGQHHGTHVAGIIAARGHPPTGIRGVAPGVVLRAYRVFAQGSGQASSFTIAKAVDQAVADKCDLLNLSLGGGSVDPTLKAAVDDARAGGSVCIIAAGNDGRGPVSFPASDELAVAVSALGRTGTFPADSAESDDVAPPPGRDKAEFIASFSNMGPELDATGPGVGIISTYPGGYAEISGTSMACPAVTGAAARLVAKAPALKKKRDATRPDAIVKALLGACVAQGFGPTLEGHGLPTVS